MIDLAFALQGRTLPADHRSRIAAAVAALLPWLAAAPGAGLHRLKLAQGSGQVLLSPRTRLVLRVPEERADDARALEGRTLDIGGHALQVGRAQARELLPWGTLFAPLVASDDGDEQGFLQRVDAELHALGIQARAISGRAQRLEDGALQGFSLMVDGLSARAAATLLQHGLGAHRLQGCGLFVPHRSAAAVGTPP